MDIRTIRFFRPPYVPMSIYVHTVGYNVQKQMARPDGFSAFQLLFVRNGQGRVRLPNKEEFDFGPMQYILLPPDLPHEYFPTSSEPWEVGYVSFLGTKVDELLQHFGMEARKLENAPDMEGVWRLLDEMWMIGDINDTGAEWEAVRLLYSLFLDLNRLRFIETVTEANPKPNAPKDRDAGSEVAGQAASYLNEHFNENITLSNVASILGYTHQYLNRLFRKTYGVSMHQYVQRVRLDKAIKLMKEIESITVKEVASLVGMETSYFIRHFRKVKGMTPDQYRKNRG